jgi:hypothetical protein
LRQSAAWSTGKYSLWLLRCWSTKAIACTNIGSLWVEANSSRPRQLSSSGRCAW